MADPLRFFRRASFSAGELARVRTFVRDNGTTMILPYDQFIEHDMRHIEAGKDAARPEYILELGEAADFDAVAFHIFDADAIDAGASSVGSHFFPGPPQYVGPDDAVIESVEPTAPTLLGRKVQSALELS